MTRKLALAMIMNRNQRKRAGEQVYGEVLRYPYFFALFCSS